MRLTHATLLAAALAVTTVSSQAPAIQVRPLPLQVPSGSAHPQLTTSSRGVLVSWIEESGKTATLKFAERTPAGWSAPRSVASGTDWFVNWADLPSVLRLADGRLVAHWLRKTHEYLTSYDLLLSSSNDEGKTWSAPFMPHHDGTKTQHGFASLFDIPGGGLGVLWLDGRGTAPEVAGDDGGSMSLRYATFDRAWKQTGESVVDERVCDCCPIATVTTANGVIAAFRDRDPKEIRDIYVARLQNGKWSAGTPVHKDNWEIDDCPVNGPAISARGQQVVVAWFTAINDQGRAYAAFSTDGGRTFGAPARLDDGTSLGHVDVELRVDGSAIATWLEFADRRSELRIRHITASGTKSASVTVANVGRSTGIPRMATSGDEVVLAWTESTPPAGGKGDPVTTVKTAAARLAR
ncbi:MAG: exo-alpha-sialidase [Acidobacteria bacterium]|nr:exo-alpha-sialidase [Acidobacteriota bacterium]